MDERRLILAAAAIDATGVVAAPAAVVVEGGRVAEIGSPQKIGEVSGATVERLADDEVVTPAFANAHAHLDLSHMGCAPQRDGQRDGQHDGRPIGFEEFGARIRAARLTAPAEIASSVRLGIDLSLRGGVAAVGDIVGARSLVPIEELRHSPLRGVGFVEVFGQGTRQDATIDFLDHLLDAFDAESDGVSVGLQPHAPYSCGPRVYAHAAELGRRLGLPLSTHLAETAEELEFVRHGRGPLVDWLRTIGVWDNSILGTSAGVGLHPVDALEGPLGIGRWIVAHANRIEARHVAVLAEREVTVAYCPRTHRHFGHHLDGSAPHRWRDMLAAGVPMAIATDGLPCVDTPERLTPLDDARLLYAEGDAHAIDLLAAITAVPARALGLDPTDFRLRGGAGAGLLAVSCKVGAVRDASAPLSLPPGAGTLRWLTNPWMGAGLHSYDGGFPRAGACGS